MNFISSIFIGTPGSYNICGIKVDFEEKESFTQDIYPTNCFIESIVTNKILQYITLSKVFSFVHEMSHALAWKWFINVGEIPNVKIYTNIMQGVTLYRYPKRCVISHVQDNIMHFAGPFIETVFSVSLLVVCVALKTFISWPIALIISMPPAISLIGQFFYCFISVVARTEGDFAKIARSSTIHLLLAVAAFVGVYALGFFGIAAVL